MKPFYSSEIQLYIFDLDGTLINTEEKMEHNWNQALQTIGLDSEKYPYHYIVGLSVNQWNDKLKSIFGELFPVDLFINCLINLREEKDLENENVKVMPGARELLSLLAAKKKMCCIATSNKRETAIDLLNKADLLQFFSFICSRDDVERAKPDPSIYNLALKTGQCEAIKAYAIEDSFIGGLAAQRADIPLILVPSFHFPPEYLSQLSFQKKCSSLMELLELNQL